jgi:hypothetical protein
LADSKHVHSILSAGFLHTPSCLVVEVQHDGVGAARVVQLEVESCLGLWICLQSIPNIVTTVVVIVDMLGSLIVLISIVADFVGMHGLIPADNSINNDVLLIVAHGKALLNS